MKCRQDGLRRLPAVMLATLFFVHAVRADFLTDWNNMQLATIRTTPVDPLYASRNLAILQVAMFDAINGVNRTDPGFFVFNNAPAGSSLGATMAATGLRVMNSLYGPNAAYTTLYNSQIASLSDTPTSISNGLTWGTSVANNIISQRSNDGASNSNTTYTPTGQQGDWATTPPGNLPALRPGWGDFLNVTPFALNTSSQFRPNDPPPAISFSSAYTADFNQVKSLGRDVGSTRTTDQTNIAFFWADPQGTVTTSGHWNQALQNITIGLPINQKAKVFAAVNVAIADAVIATWDAKYTYHKWRPVTAIRDEAVRDTGVAYNNPSITGDAAWAPLVITPNSPEYVSMTSSASQAAATTLAKLFGGNNKSFTITADTNGDGTVDMTRNYTSFSQAADEAGLSGIYGGTQFNFSVQDGKTLGDTVGQFVASNASFAPLPVPEPSGALCLLAAGLLFGARRRR